MVQCRVSRKGTSLSIVEDTQRLVPRPKSARLQQPNDSLCAEPHCSV
uniref:Uncharacterized protein n=1 Tax=Arundo donax TaxID=35708 RepID=A0A0A9AU75_ARUDO